MIATSAVSRRAFYLAFVLLLITSWSSRSWAQACETGSDINAAAKAAIENAAQRYFSMSAQGDVAGLKSNAIPSVAGNFTGIEQAVVDNKKYLAEGQPSVTGTYLLDASQLKDAQRADFYCGIYNSSQRVAFSIPGLPAGPLCGGHSEGFGR